MRSTKTEASPSVSALAGMGRAEFSLGDIGHKAENETTIIREPLPLGNARAQRAAVPIQLAAARNSSEAPESTSKP